MKLRWLYCMIGCLLWSSVSQAVVQVDIYNYKESVQLSGSVTVEDLWWGNSTIDWRGDTEGSNTRLGVLPRTVLGRVIRYFDSNIESCGATLENNYRNVLTEESRVKFTAWVNSYLAKSPIQKLTYQADIDLAGKIEGLNTNALYFRCRNVGTGKIVHVQMYPDFAQSVNPPPEFNESSCTLNNQSLSLQFSSSSLYVSGQMQTGSIQVSCSAGDPVDYTMKLTGTNVTNGNLNFGNGVSAAITLNGASIKANGAAIQFHKLVSQNISVSATLVGSANSPGVTTASGVLVLEAL
ncbi:TPA: hypothetical protein ACRR2I_003887 [Providencia rettgeri]